MVRRTAQLAPNYLPDIQLSKNLARLRPGGYGGQAAVAFRANAASTRPDRSTRNDPALRSQFGGEYRDRTGDLLRAKQALSQLS